MVGFMLYEFHLNKKRKNIFIAMDICCRNIKTSRMAGTKFRMMLVRGEEREQDKGWVCRELKRD